MVMFQFTHPLPKQFWVACSGGIDSMSVLHFLRQPRKNGLLGVIHIDHGTNHAAEASKFVKLFCDAINVNICTYKVHGQPPAGESKECWWRDKRYEYFESVPGEAPIILAHNFNDCLEEYLMCVMIKGYVGTIPYSNGRCVRPFRLWKRQDIEAYAKRNAIPHIEDPSNKNDEYKRNYIRQHIVPHALLINPGLYKIVERTIKKQDDYNRQSG